MDKHKFINSILNEKCALQLTLTQETKKNLLKIRKKFTNYYDKSESINAFDTITKKPNIRHLGTKYFSDDVKSSILENYNGGKALTYDTGTINIIINFYLMRSNPVTRQMLVNYARVMVAWIQTAQHYEHTSCVKDLKIDVFLTNVKKKLAKPGETVGAKHVNTALTYRCNGGESYICLYRQEDILKVFFHETFHTFKLDFVESGKTLMKDVFEINSEFNLFESYCETWARIINTLVYSSLLDDGDDMKIFEATYTIESTFALFQCFKMLQLMSLDLTDLIDNKQKTTANFNESSNVFSYYIITALLMSNINGFISFCKNNNINLLKFNDGKLEPYKALIYDALMSSLIKQFKCMESYKTTFMTNTSKMILFELFE